MARAILFRESVRVFCTRGPVAEDHAKGTLGISKIYGVQIDRNVLRRVHDSLGGDTPVEVAVESLTSRVKTDAFNLE